MPLAWGHTRLLETDWRLITQESHCFSCGSVNTYKNSDYLPSILEDQEKYLYTFFGALDNSPLVEEGKVKSTFIKAYEQFLDKKPDSPSGIELSGYYNILKDNDFKAPYDQENPEDLLRFRQETEQRVKSILQFYTSP